MSLKLWGSHSHSVRLLGTLAFVLVQFFASTWCWRDCQRGVRRGAACIGCKLEASIQCFPSLSCSHSFHRSTVRQCLACDGASINLPRPQRARSASCAAGGPTKHHTVCTARTGREIAAGKAQINYRDPNPNLNPNPCDRCGRCGVSSYRCAGGLSQLIFWCRYYFGPYRLSISSKQLRDIENSTIFD